MNIPESISAVFWVILAISAAEKCHRLKAEEFIFLKEMQCVFTEGFFDSICVFIVNELHEICISVLSRKYIENILWCLKAVANVCGTFIVV
jgi:hypothetical protein